MPPADTPDRHADWGLPILHQVRLCAAARYVRLALGEVGIAVTLQDSASAADDATADEDDHLPPVLVHPDGRTWTGAYAITEGLVDDLADELAGFLASDMAMANVRPAGRLLPGTGAERAWTRALVERLRHGLHRAATAPLVREKVQARIAPPGLARPPDLAVLRQARTALRRHVSDIARLADHSPWLAGADLTLADLAAAAELSVADYLGEVDWTAYPSVKLWYMRMKSRPAMRPLLADRVPGVPAASHYAHLDF